MSQRIPVLFDKKPCYDIYIGRGFEELENELSSIVDKERKVCIVTDSIVGPLYAESVKSIVEKIVSA